MKPQDVIILLKMAISDEGKSATYASLAQQLKMSAAEVHAAVKRAAASGLLTIQNPRQRRVDREKLLRWLRESVATSFPAKYGPIALGLPTGIAAVNLPDIQTPADDLPFVWPSPEATTRGKSIKPLYRSAPQAAKMDRSLHECLALVDLLRIGAAREKEVAIQELTRRIIPRNPVPSRQTSSPFDINEQDIEAWAGRVDAPFILPELIRRIILSLAPKARLNFPAYKGGYQPGWDGELWTEGASIFASTPKSYWEFSVQKDPEKKIKEDIKKRTDGADEALRRDSTLVLLTARRLAKKGPLETQFKQNGAWRDVRVYDAIDIAQWLVEAISAGIWFREKTGQNTIDLESAETFRGKWERDSRLLYSVACVGRDAEKEKVIGWLRAERPGPLRIRAETLQECVLFAISTIYSYKEAQNYKEVDNVNTALSLSSEEADNSLSRIVVVRNENAWHRLLSHLTAKPVSPLILIPIFPEFDGSIYKTEGHFVLIPSEPGRADEQADIYLRPFRREELAVFLFETRFTEDRSKARRIVQDSGGKLTSLVRLVKGIFFSEPTWLGRYNSSDKPSIICGLLLAGAWDPRNDNDKKVLRDLCDAKDDAIENEVNFLVRQTSDPPLREQAYSLKWRSAADAWRLLAPVLTASILTRFEKTCTEVLARSSEKYDLTPDERFLAPLYGVAERYSESLRCGLADSLAWLRVNRPALAREDIADKADSIRRDSIKTILDGDWKRWATNSDVLTTLAESDAETFLECLKRVIRAHKKTFAPLFQPQAKGVFSDFVPFGMMWAIQIIALHDSRFFSDIVSLLVSLVKIDASRTNYTPRPFSVLSELFHPLAKRSAASNEMRKSAIQRLCKDEEEIGWKLLVELSSSRYGDVIAQTIRRRFADLDKLLQDFEYYPTREVNEFFLTVDSLTKALLDKCPDRVHDLFGNSSAFSLVLDCLSNHTAHFRGKPLEEVRDIQDKLRSELSFATSGDGGQSRDRIQKIIAALDPDDPIIKDAWIFSFRAVRSFNVSETDPSAPIYVVWENRRKEVIAAIPNDDSSLATIIKLARSAPEPTLVGETVAQSALADKIERAVWFGPLLAQDTDERRFASAFTYARYPANDWARLTQQLEQLLTEGRSDVVIRLLQSVPNNADTRDWIEKELPNAIDEYWREAHYVDEKKLRDSDDFNRCITNLARSKKWYDALNLADRTITHDSGYVDVGAVIKLLEDMDTSVGVTSMARDINNIFHWLIKHAGETYAGRIFSLAFKFLGILDDEARQPVSRRLSREPGFFVELLELIYHPASGAEENASFSAEEREKRERSARFAHRIIEGWKGYPGEGDGALSNVERNETLSQWCKEVLRLSAERDREAIGRHKVGEVLARVPAYDDGIWPCLVARQLLQKGLEEIRNGLEIARYNSRGATMRLVSEGGRQERELVARYQADADRLRLEWPETSALLDSMAKSFAAVARDHDKQAEQYE